MKNKLIILLLTFFAVACESKTIIEEDSDKTHEPVKPTSYFAALDSYDSQERRGLFGYSIDLVQTGNLFTNVDYVRLYTYKTLDEDQKEFKDLNTNIKLNNLEAFFFRTPCTLSSLN